ncbi:hypothetical protein SprV_0200556100 [Sparganum proliferum]
MSNPNMQRPSFRRLQPSTPVPTASNMSTVTTSFTHSDKPRRTSPEVRKRQLENSTWCLSKRLCRHPVPSPMKAITTTTTTAAAAVAKDTIIVIPVVHTLSHVTTSTMTATTTKYLTETTFENTPDAPSTTTLKTIALTKSSVDRTPSCPIAISHSLHASPWPVTSEFGKMRRAHQCQGADIFSSHPPALSAVPTHIDYMRIHDCETYHITDTLSAPCTLDNSSISGTTCESSNSPVKASSTPLLPTQRSPSTLSGVINHLPIRHTETGEPIPGAPACTHCTRLYYHCVGLLDHMRLYEY